MKIEIITSLVYNASLLLAMIIISTNILIRNHFGNIKYKILVGFLNGLFCVVLMNTPLVVSSVIMMDARSILLGATAMFFGPVPTVITLVIFIVARLLIGRAGILLALAGVIYYCVIGLLWNKLRLPKIEEKGRKNWLEFYIMGVLLQVCTLICLFLLPADVRKVSFNDIWPPVILIYPVVTLLISILIYNQIEYSNKNTRYVKDLKESESRYRSLFYEFENKESFLRSLINSVPDIIFAKSKNGEYTACNRSYEIFTGKTVEDIIGHTDIDFYSEDEAEHIRNTDKDVFDSGNEKRYDREELYPDGRKVIYETLKTPYYDINGEVIGLIGIGRDITDRKKKEKEILYLMYHDALTGLYNRTFYEKAMGDFEIQTPLPFSLILADLNGLKLLNDAFGHITGDRALTETADILRKCARTDDVVFRLGGDEFCMLLPHTDSGAVQKVVGNINSLCTQYAKNNSLFNYFSLSIGYATAIKDEEHIENLFKTAEDFMYKKKLLEHKSTHSSIIASIKTTMYEKSYETEEHAERLAEFSLKLGRQLKLKDEQLVELRLFATLHDIGKIGVDERILTKKAKLNEEDWREIRKHPEIGYRISQSSPELKHISEYILCHHERWDGNGYPQGLSGEEIPLLSRVLSIVDAYDAMTNERVYRKAMAREEAIAEIVKNSGSQFDPEIAEVFVKKVLGEPFK